MLLWEPIRELFWISGPTCSMRLHLHVGDVRCMFLVGIHNQHHSHETYVFHFEITACTGQRKSDALNPLVLATRVIEDKRFRAQVQLLRKVNIQFIIKLSSEDNRRSVTILPSYTAALEICLSEPLNHFRFSVSDKRLLTNLSR